MNGPYSGPILITSGPLRCQMGSILGLRSCFCDVLPRHCCPSGRGGGGRAVGSRARRAAPPRGRAPSAAWRRPASSTARLPTSVCSSSRCTPTATTTASSASAARRLARGRGSGRTSQNVSPATHRTPTSGAAGRPPPVDTMPEMIRTRSRWRSRATRSVRTALADAGCCILRP